MVHGVLTRDEENTSQCPVDWLALNTTELSTKVDFTEHQQAGSDEIQYLSRKMPTWTAAFIQYTAYIRHPSTTINFTSSLIINCLKLLTPTFCLPRGGGHETEHCTCFVIVIMSLWRLNAYLHRWKNFKFREAVKWGVENFCTKLPKGTPLRQIWSNESFGVCGSDDVLTLYDAKKKKYVRIAIGKSSRL